MTSPLVLSRLPLRQTEAWCSLDTRHPRIIRFHPTRRLPPGAVLGVLNPSGSQLLFSSALPLNATPKAVITGDGNTFYLVGSSTVGDLASNATLNAQGLEWLLGSWFNLSVSVSRQHGSLCARVHLSGPIGPVLRPECASPIGLRHYARWEPAAGSGFTDVQHEFHGAEATVINRCLSTPPGLLTSPLTPGEVIEVRGTGFLPGQHLCSQRPIQVLVPAGAWRYSNLPSMARNSSVAFSQEQLIWPLRQRANSRLVLL